MENQLVIEIEKTTLSTRSFDNKRGGSVEVREQVGYVRIPGKRYPVEITIGLKHDRGGAWPVGHYTLSMESIWVNKYHQLDISNELDLLELSKKESEKLSIVNN